MKRYWAAALYAAAIGGLSACEGAQEPQDGSTTSAARPNEPGVASAAEAPEPTETAAAASPTADGVPAFAVLYPGGMVEGDPILAGGSAGPGGLVTYLTDADPEAVIAFHRQKAEAAGLASVMAMNQGEARAYGAAKGANNLQVVAAPTPEGPTSVQLSWSAG